MGLDVTYEFGNINIQFRASSKWKIQRVAFECGFRHLAFIACISQSLFIGEKMSFIQMYCNSFNYTPGDVHLGCCKFRTIKNKVATNTHIHMLSSLG